MFNNAIRRFLRFIQFDLEFRASLDEKGTWQMYINLTNDLIVKTDDSEPLRVVGFQLDDAPTSKPSITSDETVK